MTFKITYKRSVHRDLKNLSKENARHILDQIERDLPENALSSPVLKGPFAGLRKYRVGDYRVIFAIVENEARVFRIGHRSNVYKKPIE